MARRIDHIVVAVRDLDAAARLFERMGFQVGARNRHPWGTENRLIQFKASFIELITVGDDPQAIPPHAPRRFSFGAFVRDVLRAREGLAMLVLDSRDAVVDAGHFREAGIGDFEPLAFERRGRRPDGSETVVAFTLAFAADPAAPHAGFFVCQQLRPENFWNPDFQRHPNGAGDICAVTLEAPEPSAHVGFLSAFAASAGTPHAVPLRDGRIVLRREAGIDTPRLAGFALPVRDLAGQADRLREAAIPYQASEGALVVPSPAAHGVEIRFEPA